MPVEPIVGAGYIVAVNSIADQVNGGGATVPAATTAVAGVVKQITFTAQQSPDFADLAAVTVAYNALLTKLIAAGIMPAA
ncbi:hypothetical protein D9M71_391070 [compost metagenome]